MAGWYVSETHKNPICVFAIGTAATPERASNEYGGGSSSGHHLGYGASNSKNHSNARMMIKIIDFDQIFQSLFSSLISTTTTAPSTTTKKKTPIPIEYIAPLLSQACPSTSPKTTTTTRILSTRSTHLAYSHFRTIIIKIITATLRTTSKIVSSITCLKYYHNIICRASNNSSYSDSINQLIDRT